MALKTILNYSPNFNPKKRPSKQIKFIIFHYTGMKSESIALERLTDIQSEVSCHYLIKNNGEIIKIVPDLYIAWHAGKSSWKNYKSLNQNSIGIEITNPGHEHGYKKFTQKQITSLLKLSKFLIKKYNKDFLSWAIEKKYQGKKIGKNNLKNFCLQGGMNPRILFKKEVEIFKEVDKYLNVFKNHPYIFNLGHGLLPKTNQHILQKVVKRVNSFK